MQLVAFIMSDQHFTYLRNSRRLTSLVVGLCFLITTVPAYAKSNFNPKNPKPASKYSRGGAGRCPGSITLLAPQPFIGKTASVRPMFAWHMSSSKNVRLQFGLFEFTSDKSTPKQIGNFQKIPAKRGINKLKLPSNYTKLTVDKTYLWQIAIDCGSSPIVKRAEFTVIKPPQLSTKKKFTSIPESVDYYADKELWYEALEEALKAADNGKLGQKGSILVQELAQSEEKFVEKLAQSEKKDYIEILRQRIKYLKKIYRENL